MKIKEIVANSVFKGKETKEEINRRPNVCMRDVFKVDYDCSFENCGDCHDSEVKEILDKVNL